MLRSKFDDELEKLHNQFYAMGTEVLSQINKTVQAFISHDRELAKEVIEGDEVVNNFETKLEKISRDYRSPTTCITRFAYSYHCFESFK